MVQSSSDKAIPNQGEGRTKWWRRPLYYSSESVAWLATLVVASIALLALAGWLFQITLFKSVLAKWQAMSIITALCFLLVAVELACMLRDPAAARRRFLFQAPALLVGLAGLATVALYVVSLGAGQAPTVRLIPVLNLLWKPGTRPALLTAILFLCTGCSLALLARGRRRAANAAHLLMVLVGLSGYLVVLSYLLGVESLHRLLNVSVAMNTGLAFCIASVAMLHLQPDSWLMGAFTSNRAGGVMARRLLPAILLIPLMVGWLRRYGERSGLFGPEAGALLVALAYATLLLGLLWLTARSINRKDEQWQLSEQRRAAEINTLIDAVPFLVSLHGPDGRWLRTNPAAREVFGFDPTTGTREEVASRVQARLPDGTPLTPANMPSSRALRGESVFGEEYLVTDAKGEDHTLLLNAIPLKVDDEVNGMVLAQMDITERKRIERELADSRRELSAMLENVPLVMLLVDRERRVRKANATASNFANRTPEEMVGRSCGEALRCLHATDAAQWCGFGPECGDCAVRSAVQETFATGRNQRGVKATISFGHRGQPEELTFLISTSLFTLSDEDLCLVCIENITERKQAERSLQHAHDELEQRVALRTAELNQLNVALESEIVERKRAEEEVRLINAELEVRVRQRTIEFEEKNAELERMNRLFVGRELRMIELKERIQELEKEISG